MSFPSKCDLCEHESKEKMYECGPHTFGKVKERYVCRNYECSAFSEYHLYPGEKMPEKKEVACGVPDLEFTAEDEQPLFTEEEKPAPKKKSAAKKTAKK